MGVLCFGLGELYFRTQAVKVYMVPSSLVLPLISLLVGVLSLFTDVGQPRGRRVAVVLVGLLMIACGFQVRESFENQQQSNWQKEQITNLSIALRSFEDKTATSLEEIKVLLKLFGSVKENPSLDDAKQSLRADLLRTRRTQAAGSAGSSSRQQVTVRYFPKDVDRRIVEAALRELGFNLTRGQANLPDLPTNAIWFGDDVSIEDVKLVAYTLIRAGVEIKAIRPFRNPDGKSRQIQVGSDEDYLSREPLSVEEIEQAQRFTR